MPQINLIPFEEFERVREASLDTYDRLRLVADMCRANALAAVKLAGSGHLGSSFSAMDVVVWLYYEQMNTARVGYDDPNRDIYFSSKGHDVPGLYAVLHSLGVLPEEKLLKLRRLGGLDGHPNVAIPGIEANSGSLGMGISKGKGMAWAKRLGGHGGQVWVLTGDGELGEGQNYEALQTAVHQRVGNLNVIVDHNKVQSDKPVSEILDLGDLEAKFKAFGWQVARCDGHDLPELGRILGEFAQTTDRPKILIADTIKGRGVSFMEHPAALRANKGLYYWHAGAPPDRYFTMAYEQLAERLNGRLGELGLEPLALRDVTPEDKAASGVTDEFVARAFGQALVEIGARRKDLVVLDGDLAADCRIRGFEEAYPERFIENGIAEQDMVSTAGGLARMGLLPVVNSFASFLAARANEQIYNNAGEKTKIVYACHFGGLIPAGPGSSHQSLRDVSLLGALPNMTIVEPCNAAEAKLATEWCVDVATENCALRLVIGPSPRTIELPADYRFAPGRGVALTEGADATMFAYGPVMLHEALVAAEALRERGFGLQVVNMPWLNQVDPAWLAWAVGGRDDPIYVLEDHSAFGGLGDTLLNALVANTLLGSRRFEKIAAEGWPACGTPTEVLRHHGLDGATLADRIAMARPVAAR